ncbi:hypothetical protein ACLOJK_041729 [Asimina triloba]
MGTLVALRAFHAGERRLFERLLNLGEDPFLSKKIMAFWLWLESVGYHDLLQRIQSHSDRFLLLIAAEAETCLSCLESSTGTGSTTIPITASLTEQPLISLSLGHLERHREVARSGISHIFNGVCALVFDDIIIHRGMTRGMGLGQQQPAAASAGGDNSSSGGGGGGGYSAALCGAGLSTVSGLYNPWSRPFHVPVPRKYQATEAGGEGSSSSSSSSSETELLALHSTLLHVHAGSIEASMELNPMVMAMAMARPWTTTTTMLDQVMSTADQEQRCLFVTFSRGYPLSRGEIIDFFTE